MRPSFRLPGGRPRVLLVTLTLSCFISVLTVPALARRQADTLPPSLTGVFTVSIDRDDVPPGLAGGEALEGRWNLTFDDDETYSLARHDVGEVVSGTFETGQATLAFNEWNGILGCEASEDGIVSATYAWRLTDDLLTLTPIDDTCAERLTLLTTRALGHFDACEVEMPVIVDPFAPEDVIGTPAAERPAPGGVASQEGFSEGIEAETAIDALLRGANGCWATAQPGQFMALHSVALANQISMMGPVDTFTRELREFMAAPLTLKRVGEVTLDDPTHAWAYVEVNLADQINPQRLNFVLENGVWRLDTLFLFGPPIPGAPIGLVP